jgi:V/A-type H+-transporting ATPase subunit A
VSWLDSYSEYVDDLGAWWSDQGMPEWPSLRRDIMGLLQQEHRLQQVVKLVGPDVLPDSQRIILEACSLFKSAFLQQDVFMEIDAYTPLEKQLKMLKIIVLFYQLGSRAIQRGATLVAVRGLKIYRDIMRMRFTVKNDELSKLDRMTSDLERAMGELESHHAGM